MASLSVVRDALAVQIRTTGIRAYPKTAGDISPPAAVIIPRRILYAVTQEQTTNDLAFWVALAASSAVERAGQDLIDAFLDTSGPKSLKAAIEADPELGGVVDDTVVEGMDQYGDIEIAGIQYWGARLMVSCMVL